MLSSLLEATGARFAAWLDLVQGIGELTREVRGLELDGAEALLEQVPAALRELEEASACYQARAQELEAAGSTAERLSRGRTAWGALTEAAAAAERVAGLRAELAAARRWAQLAAGPGGAAEA